MSIVNANTFVRALKSAMLLLLLFLSCMVFSQNSVVFTAAALKGGGLNPGNASFYDRAEVNAVYAAETGEKSVMKAGFTVDSLPAAPVLKIQGRYHDGELPDCFISITMNSTVLYSGPSGFGNKEWTERSFPIPSGVLKTGQNELAIRNLSPQGKNGVPPWFMVSMAGIGQQGFELKIPRDIFRQFNISLPDQKRAMQAPGAGKKGFALRGIKGWAWTPEQTMAEIPYLKQFNLNFFMNCYLSMSDFPNDNQWWKPFDVSFSKKYEEIVRLCKQNSIEFCFAMNPNLYSSRHIDYKSKKDFEDLWQHYKWMAGLGVNWFSVCLDDITTGLNAEAQADFVNKLYKRLLKINPHAKLIFCPTIYASSYTVKGIDDNAAYLRTVGRVLHPEIYCFWTGDFVCGPITTQKAKEFKVLIGHRLIVWDNYPVNDGHEAMHLGPVVLRDKDLPEACDGYMANSMYTQSQLNRIPVYTCADYALNPWEYDPLQSIGQAILHLAQNREQAETLKDVAEVYYGFLLSSGNFNTNLNTARDVFKRLLGIKQGYVAAELFRNHLKDIYNRLEHQFPKQYEAERATILKDIKWMTEQLAISE